jgi:hypothetical protein
MIVQVIAQNRGAPARCVASAWTHMVIWGEAHSAARILSAQCGILQSNAHVKLRMHPLQIKDAPATGGCPAIGQDRRPSRLGLAAHQYVRI